MLVYVLPVKSIGGGFITIGGRRRMDREKGGERGREEEQEEEVG